MGFDAFNSGSFGHPQKASPAFQKEYVPFLTSSIQLNNAPTGTSSIVAGVAGKSIHLYGMVLTNSVTNAVGGYVKEETSGRTLLGATASINGPFFWTIENAIVVPEGDDLQFQLALNQSGASVWMTVIYTLC